MSLQLDARQRAMLREMGIELFLPQAIPDEVDVVPGLTRDPRPAAAPPVEAATTRSAGGSRVEPGATRAAPAVAAPVAAEAPLRQRLPGTEAMDWDALATAVAECRACGLCDGRRNAVVGVGDPQADWLVVGEAPGEQDDLQGEPFAGPEGKLLDNMLGALGLHRRERVYITHVVKCRPAVNRNPEPEELAQCEPFLRRQVELVQPKIILAMGRFAVQALLQTNEPLGRLRGRVHRYHGVPVVVTYPPAALLRTPADKAKAWADLVLAQSVMREA